MGLLDDIMAADAEFLVDPDEFGESVTYTPKVGSAVTRNAVVDRMGLQEVEGTGALAETFDVLIPNDATNGVASVDTGGDTITFPPRVGETAVARQVVAVIDNDNGMWRLRCR